MAIVKLKNNTKGVSKVGYAAKLVNDKDGMFDYAGVGESPVGVILDAVPQNGLARVMIAGECDVYLHKKVRAGKSIRHMLIGDGAPKGAFMPYSFEPKSMYVGRALSGGKGLVRSVVNFTHTMSYDTEFTLVNTQWDDLRVPVSSVKATATNPPDFTTFIGGVGAYAFDDGPTDEQLYFSLQVPHGWEFETALHPHFHWGNNTGNSGTVCWDLEYSVAAIGSVFPSTTTITTGAVATGAQYEHSITPTTATIDMTGIKGVSAMLLGRLYRDTSEDSLTGDAHLFEIDFHYQLSSLGSWSEYYKDNRAT